MGWSVWGWLRGKGSATPTAPKSKPKSAGPEIQSLEDRTVPALSATLTGGILTIKGSEQADTIFLTQNNNRVQIRNYATQYAAANVKTIVVESKGGNDRITLNNVRKETYVYAGKGDDTVLGGAGVDHIYGGDGNDVLNGAGGNDVIYGGLGQDRVNGGSGVNKVSGNASNPSARLDPIAAEIVQLTNIERSKRGLPQLKISTKLTAAAKQHSQDMASRSAAVGLNSAHQHELLGTIAPSILSRLEYAGYSWSRYGENIAYGYTSASRMVTAWMNSPVHRKNMLDPKFKEIGVSVIKNARGVNFFTMDLATPA